jgi:RNA polymerase sigma-70 factor (ECF subfamily)
VGETDRLAQLFCAEVSSRVENGRAWAAIGPELDRELADACARGHAAAGGIILDDHTFVRDLARVVALNKRGVAGISLLSIEDLYLVCACLSQAPRAVAAFDALHGATIRAAIARVIRSDDDVAEIEQQLLVTLLVGAEGSEPLLGSYGGWAPLDRCLRVVAHRAALTWQRRYRSEGRTRQGAAAQPQLGGDTPPEIRFLKEHYRRDFSQALKEALGGLSERAQLILRWHFVDGVTVERIGKMFDVTQPTATRWLAAAREALLEDVKARLRERLGESTTELASLAALVASRLDLSLSIALGPSETSRP